MVGGLDGGRCGLLSLTGQRARSTYLLLIGLLSVVEKPELLVEFTLAGGLLVSFNELIRRRRWPNPSGGC